mmetsp:Transcript_14898/g.33070  ORF Transcript_14898/g.33070 Transcript_14898/m.33070 type:complete len:286 (+) Transcript_14898:664-1521(+)|eukprot:CAMPEP_0113325478 /NCGR_PEP_ID=MMETSP0010_2-20120614/17796_1 /TAXON_ID=216773 ORGANISM="Corethron hystrix, Strain 308" /NCGR_SAMPLE_ID=MMETSP0010_2 /ASSEMBLY_ACC=CAM_ASM_000155 /LENGTH=285 /DNA_ID=CAMNT_0000185319 /DNA_START=339 /DNA_END=1196 /DNA_ORIENTATION=- /assembly_acc=CAM_ASM_000155
MSDNGDGVAETRSPSKATITSAQKRELMYDADSGRFFESEGECIPAEEYCAVDENTGKLIRLTIEEKERMFLDSLQSYYFSGRQLLSDDEFDLLKEDLQWSGSALVSLNRKEARFLSAMKAYNKGTPIMSDDEYNALKLELKNENSKFAVSTEPKCFIDTGICTVTLQEDFFRSNLLYLPVLSILYFTWLVLSYEILHLNPIFLTIIGAFPIYKGTLTITDQYVFTNQKIAYGPCPSCEAENRVFFGDILGVQGFGEQAEVKCPQCKDKFTVLRSTLRASTLPKA